MREIHGEKVIGTSHPRQKRSQHSVEEKQMNTSAVERDDDDDEPMINSARA